MPIDCNNPGCEPDLPASMLVSISGEPESMDNTDCSTNILYLTDNPGLVDQTDDTSGDYLTTDSRYRQLSSKHQLDRHFSRCSRLYYELKQYLSWPVKNCIRPATIIVAYFDSENESMVDAIQDIYQCFKCFNHVYYTPYDKNDDPIMDSDEARELSAWGTANYTIIHHPTIDESLIDPAETSSNAYKDKQDGNEYAVYTLLNEECIPELDDNCESTGETVNTYGAQALLTAAVSASVSMDGTEALFNVHGAPQGGIRLDNVSTARLDETETWNVMGDNLHLGGVQENWPHHVNVYHKVIGYRILMSGLSATGERIDELVYQRYIRDTLNQQLIDLLVNNQAVKMQPDSLVKARLTSLIRSFVSKGLIPDSSGALDKSKFGEPYLDGNGWILTRDNLTDKNVKSRVYPAFRFCYAKQDLTNYFSISICEGV